MNRHLLTYAALSLAGGLLVFTTPVLGQDDGDVEVPDPVLRGISFSVTVPADSALAERGMPVVRVGETTYPLSYEAAQEQWTAEGVTVSDWGSATVAVVAGETTLRAASTRAIPGWWSILPPLLAIGTALLFRRVVPALFLGVWVGAWIVQGLSVAGLFWGLLDTLQVYVLNAMVDEGHAAIILFSLMIGGMVGIISRNGGTRGIVEGLTQWADTARRGQVATWGLGLLVFFDDYANTLIVGSTMRSVTDRLRISREKLAYIVDSTAAPVASLALVTTWIGFEVGLIDEAVASIPELSMSGYALFLESILYRFYPWLALFFVLSVAGTDREFGPMYDAEQRARSTGEVLGEGTSVDAAATGNDELAPKADIPSRAWNAILPVLVLVGGVLAFLWTTGTAAAGADAPMREIIGAADSYEALMYASLLGVLAAAGLSLGQGLLTLDETVEAWYAGLKSMLFAMIVLLLAWGLSNLTTVLHTANYLAAALSDALAPGVVPALIFVLSAATAFATGSSWGTMGIVMPLVIPLTWEILGSHGMASAPHYHILYSAISCVLAGAVWGDHCSPISDTTILASMASGCDHVEHVRTQLPYALSVGGVALLLGTLPVGFGLPWWAALLIGGITLRGVLYGVGRPVTSSPSQDAPEVALGKEGRTT
ncbi:MAG: sodium:proton antiporter [Bacteroidetes bacterium SW_9_63_38]|nr:MAG: sodium:proton antiporter [Bacteroidetes bacterium SW_9_63_38]